MNKGINLLIDKHNTKVFDATKNRLKVLRFTAIGLLFIVGVISVVLSILIFFSPLFELRLEEQKAMSDLAKFQLDINKLAFINDRSNSINEIIDKRSSYDKKLNIIKTEMQSDVTLDDLSIIKTKYILKFSSKNLLSLDKLLNDLASITGAGRDFSRIYMSNLSMDGKNKRFVLDVELLSI